MSEKVGAIDRPQTDEMYYAQYAGFERDANGKIRLSQGTKTQTDKNTGETHATAYTRVFPQYRIVTGKYTGVSFVRAVYVKGFGLVPGDDGDTRPMFDYPGEFKPHFINDMRACGVDWAVDLARPLFNKPVTQESVLEGVDALLLEKAQEGNFVAVKLAELNDGRLVVSTALDGVSKVSQEMGEVLQAKIQTMPSPPPPASGPATPVQAEQQRMAEYIRYLMDVAEGAEAVDAGTLMTTVRGQIAGWGIEGRPGVPVLSLLSREQLHQVMDMVATVLMSEDATFEPWMPVPAPDEADELLL